MRRSVSRAALLLLLITAASAHHSAAVGEEAAAADHAASGDAVPAVPAGARAAVAPVHPVAHSEGAADNKAAVPAAAGDARYADGDESGESEHIADVVAQDGSLSRVRKSCPPFGPCKQFCIEVRPRDPRQSPFIICEPPDHAKNPVPPYPFSPAYPYYPDYEYPYPPGPKEPLPPAPEPYPGYPYSPYYKAPYYKAPYPPPPLYYPLPVPVQSAQNSASSAAATATASTALQGLSSLVPHFRAVEEQKSSPVASKPNATPDSSEKPAASPSPSARSVYDPAYHAYPYAPPDFPVPAPCYADPRYLPPPGAQTPLALLQLFLRAESAEMMRQASGGSSEHSDSKSGPTKVNLPLENPKKSDSSVREAQMAPAYGAPFGSPFVPFGYQPMPYGYPTAPYGPANFQSSYYKSAEPKQSKPGAPPTTPYVPQNPAVPPGTELPKDDVGAPPSPAANSVLKAGIPAPAAPGSPAPPSAASSPPASSPPAAGAAKDKPPAAPAPLSAGKPKSASEVDDQPKVAVNPLHRGYPHRYGYWGQPIAPGHLYGNQYQNYPGMHYGMM
ncbi:vegetative cell wall protein gp1-like [Schistocerca piceifrons]|uniref:vegetative cell wall protein gp1-like n=1 Tax=Schistocerca piceifrons TaxID=274613 RepID=UPI001F5F44E0|nr:vegetative cell wall protein gp1-like [Schistocerca piceifrons]